MLKTIKNLFLLCGILLFSSIPSYAFLNGGYVDGITPGDCYITFSSMSVSSNTVNVDTIQINNVISDRTYVSTNMTNIPITVSVTNTGVSAVAFTLDLRIYPDTLGGPSLNIGYTRTPLSQACNIAAGATATYSFTIDASAAIDKTYPVIVDARAIGSSPPFGNDAFWTAIDGSVVSGAVTPWIFDTRDAPFPISVIATPNTLGIGLVTIDITFSRAMTRNIAPVVELVSSNGSVVATYVGTWNSTVNWSGTLNVPLTWSTGYYGVSINGAADDSGVAMSVYLENSQAPVGLTRGSFLVTRNVPVPIVVTVVPNPAVNGTITLNVQFDQQMSTNSTAVFQATLGATVYTWNGGWLTPPTNTWVGTLDATALAEGIYTLSGSGALSMTGLLMAASANLGTFEIDRSPPTVNLYHDPTGNAGASFPVTLVAVDFDVIPQAPVLWAQFQLMDGSFTNVQVTGWSSVGGVTWSGIVMIPINASPNTVATFNSLMVTDNAGLTSNVINSGVTFNIGSGMPYITNITFDNAPVIDWDYIGTTPVIRFLIVDGANSGAIATASIRITMNGVLLLSGSELTQVGTGPNVYQCVYQITTPLTPGTYRFVFGASDVSGNAALPVGVILRVTDSDTPDLVREPFNGPNPFSPNGDGVDDVTYIVYELNRAVPVRIYIFNMDGEIMWRKDIEEGEEGAHAGYNSVMWEGETSMGDTLPNGVYIGHIIVKDDGEKKSLGRVRIVILK